MKVYIINSMCGSGSTGRIVSDTYSTLISAGHSVRVAYGIGNASRVAIEDTFKVNNKTGYYVHNLLSRITDKAGLYSAAQTYRLVDDIELYNPDIIQLHNLHGYWVNYEILFRYLKDSSRKVVWTLHDCWSFTGHCAHFDHAGCEQWKKGCEKCNHLCDYPKCYFGGNVKRNYDLKRRLFTDINMTVVTPSSWLAGMAKESFLQNHQINVINNGIDLDVFRPTDSDFKEKLGIVDKKVVLAVSSVWNKKKGYDDLDKIADSLPNDYQMVVVGLTDDQMKKVSTNVIGIKRTDSVEELVKIYSCATCFINPTYEDTFPTVNIEALACGTPVVSYRTGGSPEILDEKCGIVVSKGDVQSMCQAIIQATKKDRKDARERAQRFNKVDKYREYAELYGKIILDNEGGAQQ